MGKPTTHTRSPIATAENLKAWREAMGYSQREACVQLGCSRNAYAGWEDGSHDVPRYIALACNSLALGMDEPGKKAA